VYGLLDAGDSAITQLIKINKAFLGKMSAQQMAQYADSVNFNPNNLNVSICRIKNESRIDSVVLDTAIIIKDPFDSDGSPGIFSIENNIIYTFENDNFLNSDSEYEIFIKNNITGNSVSSTTEILKEFGFSSGIPTNTSKKMTFCVLNLDGSTYSYRNKGFNWSDPNNAEIFQFILRFKYKENGLEKELLWNQTELGRGENTLILSGEDFFHQFLANNLDALDDDDEREFISIDIEMTIGTQDLKTYIAVNEPITGIVQERPQFTNINNGIGLFSSRYTKVYPGLSLNADSEKYIIEELGLNFK
jgi:hypothetical protein